MEKSVRTESLVVPQDARKLETATQQFDSPRAAGPADPMSPSETVFWFALATLLMWLAVHVVIPQLRSWFAMPPTTCWCVVGGCLFLSMILATYILRQRENARQQISFAKRFRMKRLTANQAAFTFRTFLFCATCSILIIVTWRAFNRQTGLIWRPSLHPELLWLPPLSVQTAALYAGWPFLYLLNIFGEEFWWRGYMLKRMELSTGSLTWLVHGLGFTIYHLPLGVDLTIILAPFLFAMPYVVQKTQSLYSGILLHGTLNGGGLIALALGLIK